ncbi:MAG: caspase family protein [Planctomycetes bacterium]|nr:caspase family protein [Planctomycetota bacterium]
MLHRYLFVMIAVTMFTSSVSADEGKRYAMLVGVQKYDNAQFKPVEFAEADVTDLASVLTPAGYEVTLLTDAAGRKDKALEPTKANVEKSLKAVLGKCKRDDLVFVAFAGHGVKPDGKPGAFLCPKDAKPLPEGVASLLSLEAICKDLADSSAGKVVLLVDACRETPKDGRSTGVDGEAVKVPAGVFAMFSCSAGQRAIESKDLGHGLFFHNVIEGLKGKAVDGDDMVTFASLARQVGIDVSKQAAKVNKDAEQTPFPHSAKAAKSPTLTRHPEAIPESEWKEYLGVWSNNGTKSFLEKHGPKRSAAWRKSAEAGSPRGMMLHADCFEFGIGVPKDPKLCASWYGKGANAGNSFAMVGFGMCLQSGMGVAKDAKEAVGWFRKSAELGDTGGMQLLGSCYTNGMGIEKDEEEGFSWYRKAADLGFGQAIVSVGVGYLDGVGVKQDEKEAVRWFRKGAAQGGHSSMVYLGVCYQNGLGVEEDEKQAVGWFRKAADLGDAFAMTMLARCYMDGSGVDEDSKEGVKWLRKAAELDNVSAMLSLSNCYLAGIGVDKDRKEATRWLRKAAALGNAKAKELLETLRD